MQGSEVPASENHISLLHKLLRSSLWRKENRPEIACFPDKCLNWIITNHREPITWNQFCDNCFYAPWVLGQMCNYITLIDYNPGTLVTSMTMGCIPKPMHFKAWLLTLHFTINQNTEWYYSEYSNRVSHQVIKLCWVKCSCILTPTVISQSPQIWFDLKLYTFNTIHVSG